MKVEYVEEGSSLRHLDIEIPAEQLSEEFEKGVSRLRRTAKLPGFRKGKIPKDVIKSRFHSDVMNQAVNDLIPEALNDAIRDQKLRPINDPRISNLESRLGEPLRFRASFEVIPEIEVKDYKGIKGTEPKTEVTDEQIDKGVESLRENHARFDPIENRGAQDGDFVVGQLIERPQAGGKERTHDGVSIEVGSETYHPALHEKLQGTKPGETVTFTANFGAEGGGPDAGGRVGSFDVRFEVMELREKVLPEIDDELAKDIGDFDTLEQLRKHLRAQAEEEARRRDEQELRSLLLEKLIENNAFDAPESLVELELDGRIEDAARSLVQRGIDPRKAGIDWQALRRDQRDSAVKSVRAALLLDRIAVQEDLKESDEELDSELRRAAEASKKSVEATRAQMLKDGSLEQLRRNMRREMAVDFIKRHAKLK